MRFEGWATEKIEHCRYFHFLASFVWSFPSPSYIPISSFITTSLLNSLSFRRSHFDDLIYRQPRTLRWAKRFSQSSNSLDSFSNVSKLILRWCRLWQWWTYIVCSCIHCHWPPFPRSRRCHMRDTVTTKLWRCYTVHIGGEPQQQVLGLPANAKIIQNSIWHVE